MHEQNLASLDDLLSLLADRGHGMYGGEAVTQLEHALQAAYLAEQQEASPSLITAALFHDLGHLVSGLAEDLEEHQVDDRHEHRALEMLEAFFPESVTEPIRLHVDAKRYLCTLQADYEQQLSPASIVSLGLQGGKMSAQEVAEFQQHPQLVEILRLRSWDDQAKVPGLKTPALSHFATYVRQACR